jgi:2',3'-cyclic-nucleotide 2'-phosphodiesterase (5'-nucleotidase family)
MLKLMRLALAAVLLVFVLPGCSSSVTFEILHFNDFHSWMLPAQEKVMDGDAEVTKDLGGGVARLARAIKDRKGPNSLVLFGGDAIQGTAFSTVFHGEESFEALNEFVDIATLGNHEFDYGQDNLRKLLSMAQFEVVCANIFNADGNLFLDKEYVIRNIDGVNIAVFGLVTDITPVTTHPNNVIGLTFGSPVSVAKRLVPELREKADVVIAVTHIGSDNDVNLAREVPGIDIIVGGHSHTALKNGIKVGDTLIVQAGDYARYLGSVRVRVDSKTKKVRSASARLIPMAPNLPKDPAVEAIVAKYDEKLGIEINQVIARAAVRLEGEKSRVRNEETNLGNLIADVQRDIARSDLAFINGGGIRDSISAGDVRISDLMRVIPFDNVIVLLEIPGSTIAKLLDRSAAKESQTGNFLHVSKGSSYTIRDGRAVDIIINGEPINPTRTYRVATSDFLAAGGDGFAEFVGNPSYETGFMLRDSLISAFRTLGTVNVTTEGRIKRQ